MYVSLFMHLIIKPLLKVYCQPGGCDIIRRTREAQCTRSASQCSEQDIEALSKL